MKKLSKFFTWDEIRSYVYILIGTFVMAIGFVFFISPYKLAPGGVYGIAIILHHLFSFPIGITGISIDIPLTLLGIYLLGPQFGFKTILGFTLLSAWVSLLEFTWGYNSLVENDPLLSSIFGGVLLGFGLGVVFRSRASSGGSDIVAMIINKFTGIPVGQSLIYVDASIVMMTLIAFDDWKIPLYSWIVIFITGRVIDTVIQGVNHDKTCIIITNKPEEVRQKILFDLKRGGTIIPAKGLYTNEDRTMIYVVLNRQEVAELHDYIYKIDSGAFMTVIDANEIFGNGFRPFGSRINL
ncbi:MAG: YitT family protein [Bacteroidales bacterium]|nr:YitT family protein [Bacteroidales bacterium]